MGARIVIGGRAIGSARGAGVVQCLCGAPVTVLGRCDACHLALQRRRLGLPPSSEQEKKRLTKYLELYSHAHQRCHHCGATSGPRCYTCGSKDVEVTSWQPEIRGRCRECRSVAIGNEHDERCPNYGM